MPSYNRVILLGNCTREIDLKYLNSGTAVCDIGLAVNDRVKKNNEWVDEVTFIDCTCFGRTAEVAGEYLRKGSPAFIEGRLKLETWQTNDGQNRSKLKVIVDRLQLLSGRSEGNEGQSRPSRPSQGSGSNYVDRAQKAYDDVRQPTANDDDIPF